MESAKPVSHQARDRKAFLGALPLDLVAQQIGRCPRTGLFCEKIVETLDPMSSPKYFDAVMFHASVEVHFPGLDDPCTENTGSDSECGFDNWQLREILEDGQ